MTPLAYAERGWLLFPARDKNSPLVKWRTNASADPAIIEKWWRRWPDAMIGLPTGIDFVVLDVDVKNPDPVYGNGFDTLAELGFALWPETPAVHTASGGCHLYFATPNPPIRNTAGAKGRGIGRGIDWRGLGGYVLAPPSSGYTWDPLLNRDSVPLAAIPTGLVPREAAIRTPERPIPQSGGLTAYAEAALRNACANNAGAPAGEQEVTLHREVFSIGTLAGSGGIPADFARAELLQVATRMPDYDSRRPWLARTIANKVERSFRRGLEHPR
jgi:Bifunctional DNA primase/polymerase, N-terminal